MFGIAIAEAVAIAVLIIVLYAALGMLDDKDDAIEDLLKENNELRIKIGEMMSQENVRQQIGKWSA